MGLPGLLGGGGGTAQSLPFFSLMWICGLICALLIPSIVLALMRLLDKPLPTWQWRGKYRAASLACWPGRWPCGRSVRVAHRDAGLAALTAAATAGGGAAAVVADRVRARGLGLPDNSPQRTWGILSIGLLISPIVATLVELVAMLAVLVLLVVWLSSQPGRSSS